MLFDTTFLIDLELEYRRGRLGGAMEFLQSHWETILYISIVTVAELAESGVRNVGW